MAGGMLAMLPVFVLYIALQRYFVEGIALTGVKG
jgi:multiple sugar transport system permease protein